MTTLIDKKRRWAETLLQAISAIVCAFGIIWGFAAAHKPGAIWALVSAVIVLRPGFEDSLQASLARVAANTLGALVGVGVTLATRSSGPTEIALALALVILICHWSPMETAVRSACAGVVIVMMHEGQAGSVSHLGLERLAAVITGCLAALVVGFAADRLSRRLFPATWR